MKLIILDSTTKSLKAKLSANVATAQPSCISAWADSSSTGFVEGSTEVNLNNTSFVTIVAAPANSVRRVIKGVSFYNPDTAPVEISLVYESNGVDRLIAKINLLPDETWTLDGITVTNGSISAIIANLWIDSETDPVFLAWLAATPPAYPDDIPTPFKKSYTIFISQGGTGAPTATVIHDEITELVWSYSDVGTYLLTKAGAFVENKTVPQKAEAYTDADGNYMTLERISDDVMQLKTYAAADTSVLSNDVLSGQYLNIEIYN